VPIFPLLNYSWGQHLRWDWGSCHFIVVVGTSVFIVSNATAGDVEEVEWWLWSGSCGGLVSSQMDAIQTLGSRM
jgi:hypothetical protein